MIEESKGQRKTYQERQEIEHPHDWQQKQVELEPNPPCGHCIKLKAVRALLAVETFRIVIVLMGMGHDYQRS